MKKILIVILILAASACETEMIDKIDVFGLQNGAYMRTVTPWPLNVANGIVYSKATLPTAEVKLTIEAVDPQQGTMLSSYDLRVRFVDATPANGDSSRAYTTLASLPASSFAKDPGTGYPRRELVLNSQNIMSTLGLSAASVLSGDSFEVSATMVLTDGRRFTDVNSGSEIKGGAYYKSPFFYRIVVNP